MGQGSFGGRFRIYQPILLGTPDDRRLAPGMDALKTSPDTGAKG